MAGETIGHYKIVDQIGEGGMGVVYRAIDDRLGRQVALKFLSEKLGKDDFALERFQREARATSALNHPNICAIYDIGQHEGKPYLVMELLEGRTLRQRINGGPLPMDQIIEFGAQIADALDAAHVRGIVHRDIKAANLFVTDRGQIKVLDFGLAKLVPSRQSEALADTIQVTMTAPLQVTSAGQTLGTLSYMSPEQVRGEDLDARTDLFSFGVVLYEMATGHEPFRGRTSALVTDAILHETPRPPGEGRTDVPADFDQIVAKALEKDRELRYQTAAEMRADLKRSKRESGSSMRVAAVPVPATASGPAPSAADTTTASTVRRRRGFRLGASDIGLVVGALAIAVIAGVFFKWFSGSGAAMDSVAVMPFTATGSNADIDYLTDGITDSLINGLAQLPALRVSARSVVFRYKGKNADPLQAGKDLDVKAVVTGRVAVRGDRIVIEADLTNVATGSQLWGDQYNRPASDLLNVQDQIAGEILDKLRVRLTGDERKKATKRYTDNAEAYQLYLQGRYHWYKGTIESYKRAIEYFQQAIAKDSKYALAYAGLADSYLSLGSYWVEELSEAKDAAEQAIALDPDLAEAHVALGHIKLFLDWDWASAEREFTRGITLDGASALAHDQYAGYLVTLGRSSDALVEVRRAMALDSLSPIVNADLGWCLLDAGRLDDATAQFRATIELDADSVSAHEGLGVALSQAGRHEEAIGELKTALSLSEDSPVILGALGAAYARASRTGDADNVVRDLKARAAREYVPSSALAAVYAAQGNRSQALDELERAYDEHDFSLAELRVSPWFADLRTDPRFGRLVDRVGVPK